MKTGQITEAIALLDDAAAQLRGALQSAGAVEGLALLPMIGRAAALADDARALRSAIADDADRQRRARSTACRVLEECARTIESLDARLLKLTNSPRECERGEIERARAALAMLSGAGD